MLDALDLPNQGLLSLVGAGGKTTLMWRLAFALTAQGRRVACTTTTKIFPPAFAQIDLILAQDNPFFFDQCRHSSSKLPLCLAWTRKGDKLLGLTPELVDQLLDSQIFDWILVEADGARRLPLKAPDLHEPVLPVRSTHVLAVVGLSALGQPLDEEHVCRSQQFARITGQALGTRITTQAIAQLCAHPEGLFKNTPGKARRLLWLNQADTAHSLQQGQEILARLRDMGIFPARACLGATRQNPSVLDVWS